MSLLAVDGQQTGKKAKQSRGLDRRCDLLLADCNHTFVVEKHLLIDI